MDAHSKQVAEELSSRITARYDRRSGMVHIQTKMPEPGLAALLAQLTLQELHEKARHLKNENAILHLEYLYEQQGEAQQELEQARQALIQSGDTENLLISERLEEQSNYEASLNRYNAIREQINRIQADTANHNPVFRVVNDITVPTQISEPNRILILTISLLTGVFLSVCILTFMFFIKRTN
jgi:uncharacterized protein involved in exopolysaccharide biosynthesis